MRKKKKLWDKGFHTFIYFKIIRPLMLKIKAEMVNSLDGETVLDIGYLDEKLQTKINKNYYGIDKNSQEKIKESYTLSEKKIQQIVKYQAISLEKFKTKKRFDIVCAFDILEHTLNPVKCIKKIKSLSKKYICISVPYEPYYSISRFFKPEKEHYWTIFPNLLKYYLGKPIREEFHHFKREYIAIFKK